jgi:hypothetical protein
LGLVVLAGMSGMALAQSAQTEPRYLGGYNPDACRFPPSARKAGLSGCCDMELSIDASGRVTKADGVCSDPVFLEPTKACLSVQSFMPATRNGQPVSASHHMEYEWRANAPAPTSLCRKLTS